MGKKWLFLIKCMHLISTIISTTEEADVSSVITECFNISPRFPNINQLSCHRTRIQDFGPFQTCEASFVRTQNIAVASQSQNYTIMYVHTPGRLRGRQYNNRLLCRWNIQCPPQQLMYLDIDQHNIEPEASSSLFSNPVCVDYLKMFRDFGTETTCGFRSPYAELEPNRLFAEFRSNQRIRFPGFVIRVVCFDPNLQDQEGCTATPISTILPPGKRKRSASIVDHQFFSRSVDKAEGGELLEQFIQRMTPISEQSMAFRGKRASSVIRIFVQPNVLVYFLTTSRLVVVLEAGRVTNTFRGITSLHTYNEFDGVHSYDITTLVTLSFRGNGMLSVINSICYYYIFGVDPKFIPTPFEEVLIRTLLDAQNALVVDTDFIIEEGPHEPVIPTEPLPHGQAPPTQPDPPGHPSSTRSTSGHGYTRSTRKRLTSPTKKRRKSHSSKKSKARKTAHSRSKSRQRGRRQTGPTVDPLVTDTAVMSANSCNAVVRAVAQSILNL